MVQVLSGAIGFGYLAIAFFFLRHWRTTRDRLFAYFSVAFAVLSCQRVAMTVLDPIHEDTLPAHVLRLIAYLTIAWAILDKNRTPRAK